MAKRKPKPRPCKSFLLALATLAVWLALPIVAHATAYGGDNGTVSSQESTGGGAYQTWWFNATTPGNNTGITVTKDFFEYTDQCKVWAQANPTYNSTAEEQTWTTPASGTVAYGDISRNMPRNQTISGTITLATPASAVLSGPAKSYRFDIANVADNRTVTIYGACWRRGSN